MFYYLYEIKNNLDGKIYVGVHKTKNLDDGYMGSGRIICSAIAKHGITNFSKVILEFFENAELMYAREKEIVNDLFLLNENNYNLRRGGTGGFDYINSRQLNRNDGLLNKRKNHHELSVKGGISSRNKETGIHSFDNKIKSKLCQKEKYSNGTFFQKTHSEETIKKMKNSHAGLQSGSKNSQHGTIWITNEEISKKIKKDDPIPTGWRKGRSK